MHRFEVLADSVPIGHTDLEVGDPPMGVASGKLIPLPAYAKVQSHIVASGGSSPQSIVLSIQLVGGQALVCAGVSILDCSADLGPTEIEVTALGISEPPYEELFPHHVAAYANQFK